MESLKLTDPIINKYEERDHYYYNKFKYRAKFHLKGIRASIYCNDKIDLPNQLDVPRSKFFKDWSEINIQPIENWIDWRNINKPAKLMTYRIEGNSVSVFSNDLALLESLKTLGEEIDIQYTEVKNVLTYVGTKTFVREPKHKFRIHLRPMRVNDSVLNNLRSMISANKSLYPSQAFEKWLNSTPKPNSWKYRYTFASHFVDYDDESMLTYLLIVHSNVFGKKYKLEKRQQAA
jgi:hypothetical protein